MRPDDLCSLFLTGVQAADPKQAVQAHLDKLTDPPTHILSIGKAALEMAQGVLDTFPSAQTLVVTNAENARDASGVKVLVGDHPVPAEASLTAGRAVLDFARSLGSKDHLLALISGGASALVVAPVSPVTLADKAALTTAMLGAGLDIVEINTVRQSISEIKGGGLVRAVGQARLTSLILSDVMGDDPRVIASGPTQPPLRTALDTQKILQRAGLWPKVPKSVQDVLLTKAETPPVSPSPTYIVGSNRRSVLAMAQAAQRLGWTPDLYPKDLVGDVRTAANIVLERAAQGPGLWLAGGETTVEVRGTGKGGRNQELCLRVAQGLAKRGLQASFLSAGTDGRDGPTDAAGAIVDETTWGAIPNAAAYLADNDSYTALALADALLKIPATGTNVADLQILWVP